MNECGRGEHITHARARCLPLLFPRFCVNVCHRLFQVRAAPRRAPSTTTKNVVSLVTRDRGAVSPVCSQRHESRERTRSCNAIRNGGKDNVPANIAVLAVGNELTQAQPHRITSYSSELLHSLDRISAIFYWPTPLTRGRDYLHRGGTFGSARAPIRPQ